MNETIQLTPAMMGLVPVVVMLTQLIKGFPIWKEWINPYLPLVSCGFGVGLAYAVSIANPIVAGILIGFAASTGYDLFKAKKES